MLYGKYYCMTKPARSGVANQFNNLPLVNGTGPYVCNVEYGAYAEPDSDQLCTPTGGRFASVITIRLRRIAIPGGGFSFTNNPTPGSDGETLYGTIVGQLIYSDGYWQGELSHPLFSGSAYVKICLASCSVYGAIGAFGPTAGSMTHKLTTIPSLNPGSYYQSLSLGTLAFSDAGGVNVLSGMPDFLPKYHTGLPSKFTVTGGDWNHALTTAYFGMRDTSDPDCFNGTYNTWATEQLATAPYAKNVSVGETGTPPTGFVTNDWKTTFWGWYANVGKCGCLTKGQMGYGTLTSSSGVGLSLAVGVDDVCGSWTGSSGGIGAPNIGRYALVDDGVDWFSSISMSRDSTTSSGPVFDPNTQPANVTLTPDLWSYT